MTTIGLIWRTVRSLKVRQILFQLVHRFRRRGRLHLPKTVPKTYFQSMPTTDKPVVWRDGVFTFLNQSVSFPHRVDWNYAQCGKLWTYQLNYFDWLNQPGLSIDTGLNLIHDFISQTDTLRSGLEPYPTSLRLINWVQFLSYHQIQDDLINQHLCAQTQLLNRRLEYHLAGNHLLENGFALLIGALYFQKERWLRKATWLIRAELTIQILADGGHDERSPMYHQILLDRLLTALLALQHDTWYSDPSLIAFLNQKATYMLSWLKAITFHNGDIPLVNDSASGIAPTTAHIQEKAKAVLRPTGYSAHPDEESRREGKASGYRMFRQNRHELFVDVGAVGPDHQPGHAHADTFSFVLYIDNQPVLVDSGTSTYSIGPRRSWERSTAAHNTVDIAGSNSSEVWAGFRVGRRARVAVMTDTQTTLLARHDGYRYLGIIHERGWSVESDKINIVDRLLNTRGETLAGQHGVARFYFHPAIQVKVTDHVVIAGPVQFSFASVTKWKLSVISYAMAEGFNRLQPGKCLEVVFTNRLETTLTLLHESALPNLLFRA